jgi:hypothetical protein
VDHEAFTKLVLVPALYPKQEDVDGSFSALFSVEVTTGVLMRKNASACNKLLNAALEIRYKNM